RRCSRSWQTGLPALANPRRPLAPARQRHGGRRKAQEHTQSQQPQLEQQRQSEQRQRGAADRTANGDQKNVFTAHDGGVWRNLPCLSIRPLRHAPLGGAKRAEGASVPPRKPFSYFVP